VTEQWRPVPSLPGCEASDLGRVRVWRSGTPAILPGTVGPCGFHTVMVLRGYKDRVCARAGTLVAAAWVGPRPDGAEVRRLDGNTLNDRADNLAYGTLDACPQGHRYADLWLGAWGERLCPECRRQASRALHQATRARRPEAHGDTLRRLWGSGSADLAGSRAAAEVLRCLSARDDTSTGASEPEAEDLFAARVGGGPPMKLPRRL
jgi:hypothetical protein